MEESRMIIKKTNEEVTFSIKVIHDALHKLAVAHKNLQHHY